jgi:hypothetical protein
MVSSGDLSSTANSSDSILPYILYWLYVFVKENAIVGTFMQYLHSNPGIQPP